MESGLVGSAQAARCLSAPFRNLLLCVGTCGAILGSVFLTRRSPGTDIDLTPDNSGAFADGVYGSFTSGIEDDDFWDGFRWPDESSSPARDAPPTEGLLYLSILSTPSLGNRREALRSSWLQWARGRYKGIVDYNFHVVLCKDQEHDPLHPSLESDMKKYKDVTLHINPYNLSTIHYEKKYHFCGVEAQHRLQVLESVLSMPQKYRFIAMVDDDGMLCVPTLVRDLSAALPHRNLLWGKFWCSGARIAHGMKFSAKHWARKVREAAAFRPDSNFMILSRDLLARISHTMRAAVLPANPAIHQFPGPQYRGGPHMPVPWGKAIMTAIRMLTSARGTSVNIFDDRERIDAQQDWLVNAIQDYRWDSLGDNQSKHVGRQFMRSVCKRVIWSHHVTKRFVLKQAYDVAEEEGQLAPLPSEQASAYRFSDVCQWTRRHIRGKDTNGLCEAALKPRDEISSPEWVRELCSHRYVFVRGQHHTGTGLLRDLILQSLGPDISSFSTVNTTPPVPQHEGQFLQNLWPWDNPPEKRRCYCGCASPEDWSCFYLCPRRDHLGKDFAKVLLYNWRQFWDLDKHILLEKSPDMGGQHVLQLFPSVSTVIYVMRHPWSARKTYLTPACVTDSTAANCLLEWLVMWRGIPSQNALVVRYENLVLMPQHTMDLLRRRLLHMGIVSVHSRHGARRLEKVELKEGVMPSLWSPNAGVHRAGKSIPVDINATAAACRAALSCKEAVTPYVPVLAAMGYDLLNPEWSSLGGKVPFVENLPLILDSYGLQLPTTAGCSDDLAPSCSTYVESLTAYPSPCEHLDV
mmetsp:Transcript_15830/g.28856  ORF Transcript_15830/g.28856 Transcript_15830/m.28856 type:complete len:803 (+) Transcript_15830:68-2476(+)